MRIIKLSAIDSTNTFLKELSSDNTLEDFTVVVANKQTNGRGRAGNSWQSQAGKNLIFSVFKRTKGLGFLNQFSISIGTALALVKTLNALSIPKVAVKWPNDILSANKKICGILIENVIRFNQLDSSIIGIGLNVNQTKFNDLQRASSLKIISGKTFDLDEVLNQFLVNLVFYAKEIEAGNLKKLKLEYESLLFRKNKPSTFKNTEGEFFTGYIKGISNNGLLIVLLEDEIIKKFALNEIKLMY